jgi:tetratricopeptide (TPR) repeat protein
MATPIDELPKSLQSAIADCRNAVANWDAEEGANDPILQAGNDWMLRLSRGEFEQDFYWECVAEDCEEAGDWWRAIEAYRKILDLPDLYSFNYSKAHTLIAAIHRLLGDDAAALASYEAATAALLPHDEGIFWRHRIGNQIFQLVRMGHIRRARRLVRRGLENHEHESVDHLGIARLLIGLARCELAVQQPDRACQFLQQAWHWLDTLVQSFEDDSESLRAAAGIDSTYVTWWRTEATRRRLTDDTGGEIEALQHAIEKTRLCFDPGGWQRPWHELALMRLLLRAADAYDEASRPFDAAASNAAADEIFSRRKFPESAKWVRPDNRQSSWLEFLPRWCRCFLPPNG